MATSDEHAVPGQSYPSVAKAFHWVSAVAVAFMLTTGLVMTWRGHDLGIWDELTNGLYTSHKTVGFVLLWLIVLRLANRLVFGVPPPEPTLTAAHRRIAAANHGALYALLVAMPLAGWLAVSLFPALDLFAGLSLPALTAPDRDAYETVAWAHGLGARLLMALVALHVAAALYHRFVRRDGVLARMWPGRP